MNCVTKEFENCGYVYLQDFLDENNCDDLVKELEKYVKNGKSKKDEQCPLSEAVTDTDTFDSLLEQLLPYVERASGKRLYPTYAYARMYKPGEVLKLHRDRPSCEISLTLTLGFDGEIWPIYMAKEGDDTDTLVTDDKGINHYIKEPTKVLMNVGDAVLYRGCEVFHWRDEFKGKYQAQVFLHYVDANGPYSEYKYDKREKLAHHREDDQVFFWYYSDALGLDACKKIIDSVEQNKTEKAQIGTGFDGIVDLDIRDVNKINLPSYRGIGATLAGIGLDANRQAWNFDITHVNQTDYLKYDKNGHYKEHIDTFFLKKEIECRKLTVLAFLNDNFEGGKLFIKTGHEKIYPPQNAGSVLVFPSFFLHGVEPVISGTRRSIVTWLIGPKFK
jgi:hypothetical protein